MSKKWIKQYIDDIDISKIEWIKLDMNGLMSFYENNYLDNDTWNYVINEEMVSCFCSPIGLRYLSFDYDAEDYNFLLGVVNNNIGKKTIVAAMVYLDNYYLFTEQNRPLTYISSVEVNSYFWNRGIYTEMCEIAFNYMEFNQHIMMSAESDMGMECGIFRKFRDIFIDNGFENYIWMNDESHDLMMEVYNVLCGKKRGLK